MKYCDNNNIYLYPQKVTKGLQKTVIVNIQSVVLQLKGGKSILSTPSFVTENTKHETGKNFLLYN
jgi:hypothetical protein